MRAVVLFNWTDQGIRNAKESINRIHQGRDALKSLNVTIEQMYWTLGDYDLVGIISAPDGETLAAALLNVAMQGNIRTKTMRAFDENDFQGILGKLG